MALPQSSEIKPADVACLGACRLDQGHAERQRVHGVLGIQHANTCHTMVRLTWQSLRKKRRKRRDSSAQHSGGPLAIWQLRVEELGGPLAIPSRAARLVARSCRGCNSARSHARRAWAETACNSGAHGARHISPIARSSMARASLTKG